MNYAREQGTTSCLRSQRSLFIGVPKELKLSVTVQLFPTEPLSGWITSSLMVTLSFPAYFSTYWITGSPSSLHERGRDSFLRAVLCYERLFTKVCMGCKRFFLKERKNVMFLNKIDLPYCLVVFFVCLPASQAVLKRFR